MISIGFLTPPDSAVVWRGPMASQALRQFFGDVDWGELDYILIDLPPGTSDIHLTLVQTETRTPSQHSVMAASTTVDNVSKLKPKSHTPQQKTSTTTIPLHSLTLNEPHV
jgi:Mrp family chromosome partitioning ATPase